MPEQLSLPLTQAAPPTAIRPRGLFQELASFREFGRDTRCEQIRSCSSAGECRDVPVYVNEFWTARQRAAHRLHEISYRACFKPQLPRFFIERLTRPGDRVYDPFMGRGTTLLEAALMGRVPVGCDINPLSEVLIRPRLHPPRLEEVRSRLSAIDFREPVKAPEELLVFYHPETLAQIAALREYLMRKQRQQSCDEVDDWIRMVAVNRLTGHSNGFFSVYTMPPNQAVTVVSQRRINERRNQTPPVRDVAKIILKKSKTLLSSCTPAERAALGHASGQAHLVTGRASATPEVESGSIGLVVTSPPFLKVVDYATDNWLRCWFVGVDAQRVPITVLSSLSEWQGAMLEVFQELRRVLRPGGHIAFEVGEVEGGLVRLEESILPCGMEAGLEPLLLLINEQRFTKTANCWGVDNNAKGTNSNRVVLFRKTRW